VRQPKSQWLEMSVLFTGGISPKRDIKYFKRIDFGGFSIAEVRK
jgi:hypothetical protein